MQSVVTTSVLVVAIVFPVLASLFVGLRFYIRYIKSQALKADDWSIVASVLLAWAISVNTYVCAGRAGVNTTTLDEYSATRIIYLFFWIHTFPVRLVLVVVKISILLFYRRIFITAKFRRCIDTFIAILTAWGIAGFLLAIFVCDPISSAWDPHSTKFRYNYQDAALTWAGMSLIFDIIVLCFPFAVIKKLHMDLKRKLSVLGIFWLGGFCCIASALRFYFLYQSDHGVGSSKDYSNSASGLVWAHIEPSCSIIAACLPTFGPLWTSKSNILGKFRKVLPSIGSSRKTTPIQPAKRGQSKKSWQQLAGNGNSVNSDEAPTAYRDTFPKSRIQDLESGIDDFENLRDFQLEDFDVIPFSRDRSSESPDSLITRTEKP